MGLNRDRYDRLRDILSERIMVLDGAMGTLLQSYDVDLSRPGDFLVEDRPEVIREIHDRYLESGADIIKTDSFNSNRFSLEDYNAADRAYQLARKAAATAKEEAEKYSLRTPEKPRFVAGSVGPTKHMLSLAYEGSEVDFDSMARAYREQIKGLLDGGADIILLETSFDTLNVKAAIYALETLSEERGEVIPTMISCTIEFGSGRLLSGQTIEAFFTSVRHASGLLSVGINCGFGSEQVLDHARHLAETADVAVSVHPNAGLPDNCGDYGETPMLFSKNLERCLKEGLVNIVGGCCGTTPEHIKHLSGLASKYRPRVIPASRRILVLSGLDRVEIGGNAEIVHIGERTNVAGSAKFARLIREKKFDEALDIAAKQIKAGAKIIDICMDDGMQDARANMLEFLRLIASESETAKVPVMVDSSSWDVITAALKRSQGKFIVNSISLKEGERDFIEKAREIKRLGASVVVMLFDEMGQAATYDRKIEIADRAYTLLTDIGFPPEDIIFDPNVLTVGTNPEGKDLLALDFIRTVKWIEENLPYAGVSGGISNLSFAFRGNNRIREAMHTIFMYHAGKAGLTMAIINPQMLALYSDIDVELLKLVEDLLLARRDDATNRLVDYAQKLLAESIESNVPELKEHDEEEPLSKQIREALLRGKDSKIDELVSRMLETMRPMDIIDNHLMPAMQRVGQLFGEGKLFLPQVIKSAQVMQKAVGVIKPRLKAGDEMAERANVVIATVKGDVHDIGKNIVSLVVSCNGYRVYDLGVRVEPEVIVEKTRETSPAAVLLSGLIAPSLNEMIEVCRHLENAGLDIPVIIGGAATSELHTAVKIATEYKGSVIYSKDAASNLEILNRLTDPGKRDEFLKGHVERQKNLRHSYDTARHQSVASTDWNKPMLQKNRNKVVRPKDMGLIHLENFPSEKVERFIDWNWLLSSLEMQKNGDGNKPETKGNEREELLGEVKRLYEELKGKGLLRLEGVARIFRTRTVGNDIVLETGKGKECIFPMLRAERGADKGLSLTDFLDSEEDYIALFAVSAGKDLEEIRCQYEKRGETYTSILIKLISDRLAEAFAQYMHALISSYHWGFSPTVSHPDELLGVRYAFGYPSTPDHTLKREVFRLLDAEKLTSMRLTENSMIMPSEAVCGIILSEGKYFNVGKIGDNQLEDYARRRGITVEEARKILPYNVMR